MQEEARIKYGLTTEQIREVDEQLEELAATAQVTAGGTTEDAALMGKRIFDNFPLQLICS